MAETSKIEWTEATWNPITGCSVVSPGCTNCYAMRLAGSRLRNHWSRRGLTDPSKSGPVWNGRVRFNTQWLDQPLRWRRPRMIFVCAHGDLFHEKVPDEWIDAVFAVMQRARSHTFQVLTKRADRMRDYVTKIYAEANANNPTWFERGFVWPLSRPESIPFANVWLGASTERQAEADARIPVLLDTPAAVRFVSVEPMLGPVGLTRFTIRNATGGAGHVNALTGKWRPGGLESMAADSGSRLGWLICGGESGPDARPMHPDWARSLRDQCAAAGVPFFMKQMSQKAPIPNDLLIRQWPTVAAAAA